MTGSTSSESEAATTSTPNPSPGAPGRRSVLQCLAVAGVAVPFVAACGSSSDSSTPDPTKTPTGGSGGTPGTSSPTTTSGGSDVLTSAAKVPVGGGVILASAGIVVTQPKKGMFEGFSSTCTHRGCTLHDVTGGTINCVCHGSKFSIEDGSVVNGPATSPLPKKPVKADGSGIVAG